MIQRHGTSPPFFGRLVSLDEVTLVANKSVNLVRIEHTIVIFLPQEFATADDAFQLCIVWQSYVIPIVGFSESCVVQATHGVCRNVAKSIVRSSSPLVAA